MLTEQLMKLDLATSFQKFAQKIIMNSNVHSGAIVKLFVSTESDLISVEIVTPTGAFRFAESITSELFFQFLNQFSSWNTTTDENFEEVFGKHPEPPRAPGGKL